jgi:hypothetical protein
MRRIHASLRIVVVCATILWPARSGPIRSGLRSILAPLIVAGPEVNPIYGKQDRAANRMKAADEHDGLRLILLFPPAQF